MRKDETPMVTLHKRGAIGLNRAAAEPLLAGIRQSIPVSLSWDRGTNVLVIRRCSAGDPNSFKLRVYQRRRNTYLYLIVAQRFFSASKGLRVRNARRFQAVVRDAALFINRSQTSEKVSRPELTRPRVRMPKRRRSS